MHLCTNFLLVPTYRPLIKYPLTSRFYRGVQNLNPSCIQTENVTFPLPYSEAKTSFTKCLLILDKKFKIDIKSYTNIFFLVLLDLPGAGVTEI